MMQTSHIPDVQNSNVSASEEIVEQETFWDKEIKNFDAIYSHEKSRFSNALDSLFRKDMYQRFEFTMFHAEPVQGRSFLDVGCGTGRYSLELARRSARRVVGLDISSNMVGTCNKLAKEEHLEEQTVFTQTDLLSYQTDEKFDVTIGIGLFDYIKDPSPVLRKMREHSSQCAIMSFPKLWTWRAPVRKVRLALKNCGCFFYTKTQVGELLKQAGFKRYDLFSVGQLYCVVGFVQ